METLPPASTTFSNPPNIVNGPSCGVGNCSNKLSCTYTRERRNWGGEERREPRDREEIYRCREISLPPVSELFSFSFDEQADRRVDRPTLLQSIIGRLSIAGRLAQQPIEMLLGQIKLWSFDTV